MTIKKWTKSNLKKLRSLQPFNRIATQTVKATLSFVGLKSEFVILHLHRHGLVESKLPNGKILRLHSNADDWISNQIFWRGWQGYEPEASPLFFKLASKAKVTIDIGAYVGFYSLLAAHANPEGKVYAFEPLKTIYDRLNSNIALNKLENVKTIFGAIGKKTEIAEFFHQGVNDFPSSSSLSFDFMKGTEGLISSEVSVMRLDDFVVQNEIDFVSLIKIDTEATEAEVLLGAEKLLKRDEPIIICEVLKGYAREGELGEIMDSHGYEFYLLTPEGPVKKEFIEGHPDWLNYIFAKSKHNLPSLIV